MAVVFFRLWVVLASIWIGFFLLLAGGPTEAFWRIFPTVIMGPPLVVLAIGTGFGWALGGFR